MRKYFILAVQLTFYLSALLFFKDSIAIIPAIFLIFYLSLENKYYSLIPLILCIGLDRNYSMLLIAITLVLFILYPILKKSRFYHLGFFVITLLSTLVMEWIINSFNLDMLIIMLVSIILYGIISLFYIFYKKNKTYIVASINDKLVSLTILLGYLLLIIFYNPDKLLLIFLFMQLYLLKDFKYNIIFFFSFILFYYIGYQNINTDSLSVMATSYFPISITFVLDYSKLISYFYLLYTIIVTILYFEKKEVTIEVNYINTLFKDFKKYLDGLNLEYNKLKSLKELRENHIEGIINTFCNKCKENTVCKKKMDKRFVFIANAMNTGNSNTYGCPHYEKFYFNNDIDIKASSLEYSAIRELALELEILYNQSLKLAKNYNSFLKALSFHSYNVNNIDINLANSTIFFSISLDKKKQIIPDLFLKLGYKAFGEELDIKLIEKDKEYLVYLYKKPRCKIEYSQIILPKNANIISGDNFYIKKDNNESYIFALSDGMGSGHNAYVESKETLKLISNLSSYHFSHRTILKLLENIYDLRCEYDSYATLDLLNINTASMKLNLYKLGSTTTYIYHSYNLVAYENKALPLKLDDINSAYEIEFFKGDMIFMLSDGITDNLTADELFILINPEYSTDEQMAKIIDFVKDKQMDKLSDDLSMIVVKIK